MGGGCPIIAPEAVNAFNLPFRSRRSLWIG